MAHATPIPRKDDAVLLLVDVINAMDFPDGDALLEHALPAARAIARLRDDARAAGVPVVYANDNFGDWKRHFGELVDHVLEGGVPGEPVARILAPGPDDHYVLKPRHSAFHQTPLDRLLDHLGARELVLAGFTTDYCVLFTAVEAYLRDIPLTIPADCVAAVRPEHSREALAYAARALKADTTPYLGAPAARSPVSAG